MSPLREYLCVKCGADDLFVGVETISHLREPGNGRITIMLNAFEGPPQIVRLFGKGNPPPLSSVSFADNRNRGTVHEFGTPEYEALMPLRDRKPGSRAVIAIEVHKVRTVRLHFLPPLSHPC